MNGKLVDFISTKGSSMFAVVAWIAFIVGGAFFTIVTLALAVTFEAIAQIKSKFSSIV